MQKKHIFPDYEDGENARVDTENLLFRTKRNDTQVVKEHNTLVIFDGENLFQQNKEHKRLA